MWLVAAILDRADMDHVHHHGMFYRTALLQRVTGKWEDADLPGEGGWVKWGRERQRTTAH